MLNPWQSDLNMVYAHHTAPTDHISTVCVGDADLFNRKKRARTQKTNNNAHKVRACPHCSPPRRFSSPLKRLSSSQRCESPFSCLPTHRNLGSSRDMWTTRDHCVDSKRSHLWVAKWPCLICLSAKSAARPKGQHGPTVVQQRG